MATKRKRHEVTLRTKHPIEVGNVDVELEVRLIDQNEPLDLGSLPEGSTPDQNFVDAILGRDTVKSPAECGLRVMQLSEAAWKSAESGEPVDVRALSGVDRVLYAADMARGGATSNDTFAVT